jgi:hypothetical protein
VARREISWRSLRVRSGQPVRELPRWVDRLVVVLLLGYLLGGVAAAPYTLEEAVQDSMAARTGALWTERGDPLLTGATSTPTYDAVSLAYGSVTRWAAAAGWYAAGARQAQRPIDLDQPGPPAISVPADRFLVAARLGPALLCALGVVLVLFIGRRLAGRTAGLVAAGALALHPGYLISARPAVDAGVTLTLGLAGVLTAIGIGTTVARGKEPRLAAWTAVAALAGLTLAAGYTAVPYVAGAAAFVLAGLLVRQRRRSADRARGLPDPGEVVVEHPAQAQAPSQWRWRLSGSASAAAAEPPGPGAVRTAVAPVGPALGWTAAAALGAVVVWVLVSPALWGWLPERVATRSDGRPALAAQRLLPDPGPQDLAARAGEVARVATDPFLTPEPADPGLGARDAGYARSGWAGLPLGAARGPLPSFLNRLIGLVVGGLLTLAAAAGLLVMWLRSRMQAAALTAWLLATAGWMAWVPSRQPDQALPLVALACVLSGLALPTLVAIGLNQRERSRTRLPVGGLRLRPGRSAR